MIYFKNHKSGFAFIEIMIAIMLLAIFGSSLFITQAKIFSTVERTHRKVVQTLQSALTDLEIILKKIDAKKENKPFDSITLHKEIKNPSVIIDEKIKKLSEKSELYKDFNICLQLLETTFHHDNKKNHTISFIFTPPIEEKTEKKELTPSASQNNTRTIPKGFE